MPTMSKLLQPAAVVAGRLEAEPLELRGDVAHGQLAAARGRRAPFEQIVGEEADVGGERGGGDATRGRLLARGEGRGQRRRRRWRSSEHHEPIHARLLHVLLAARAARGARRARRRRLVGEEHGRGALVEAERLHQRARATSASARCCSAATATESAAMTRSCAAPGARSRSAQPALASARGRARRASLAAGRRCTRPRSTSRRHHDRHRALVRQRARGQLVQRQRSLGIELLQHEQLRRRQTDRSLRTHSRPSRNRRTMRRIESSTRCEVDIAWGPI